MRVVMLGATLIAASGCASGSIGSAYKAHNATVPSGEGPMRAAMEAQRSEWTADVIAAGGRVRMDVTSGGQPGMFATGDYILTDSVDFIVVRPATRTFFALASFLRRADSLGQSTGAVTTLTGIVVKLDSMPGVEMIAEMPARHYRMSINYAISIDLGRIAPAGVEMPTSQMRTTIVTDYWFGDVPDVPLGRSGYSAIATFSRAGPMGALADSIAAIGSALPKARALLKTTTSTRINGSGMSGGTDVSFVIEGLKRQRIDRDRFVLPDDHRETSFPGTDSVAFHQRTPLDGGARWRRRAAP